MWRKNKETWQSSMFDINGKPLIDYGTTASDIDKILKQVPKRNLNNNVKTVVEPVKSNLVESLDPKTDLNDDKEEKISVFVPFDFYDTWLVDAIATRKKFETKSCIEFYFYVLDWKPWYAKFWKQLENIEKYFSRFFGWDWDKKYLRENMWFKRNFTDKGTIEWRAKQDRTNQFIKVVEKIKWIYYDRWYVYTGSSRFTKDWLSENKYKFINYPHEERKIRLGKRINGEEYEEKNNEGIVWIWNVIKEIDVSREAGFDDEWWLAGLVPFCFDNRWSVNHYDTLDKYTLKECIIFYLRVMQKESNYGRFSNLLTNIEAYFSKFYRWDWNTESLVKYKDLIWKISNNCCEKVIIWLDWELDLYAMNAKFGEKDTLNYVENILKNKEPFNDFTVLTCLNKFLEREWLSNALNVFNKNKDNLVYFFKEIIEQSELNKFNYGLESLWGNMWDSYRIFLNEIFSSFDLFQEEKNDNFYDKNTFDSNREDEHQNIDRETREKFGNTVWNIVNNLSIYNPYIVDDIRWMDFLPQMFASFRRSRYEADLDSVYKKNLIRVYISNRWKNITIKWRIEQDKIILLKEFLSDSFPYLKYRKWYIYGLDSRKINKDEILKYPADERKEFLIEWIRDENNIVLTQENIWTIALMNRIIDDLQLRRRLEIDDSEDHLCDKETWDMLNLVDLFQEEKDFWKIRIIEWVNWATLGEESNLQLEENNSSFWVWANSEYDGWNDERLENNIHQKSWGFLENEKDDSDDEDDDLPF